MLSSPLGVSIDLISVVLASVAAGTAYHKIVFRELRRSAAVCQHRRRDRIFFVQRLAGCCKPWIGHCRVHQQQPRRAGRESPGCSRFALLCLVLFAFRAGIPCRAASSACCFCWACRWWWACTRIFQNLLARATGQSKLSARDAIVIGNAGSASLGEFHAEFGRGRYAKPTILEFDATAPSVAWSAERSALLTRVLEAAHKTDIGDIFVMADRVSGERLAEIYDALSVVPRSVYVIPGKTQALFCATASPISGTRWRSRFKASRSARRRARSNAPSM